MKIFRERQTPSHKLTRDASTQIGTSLSSYGRFSQSKTINFRILLKEIICDKETVVQWCINNSILKRQMRCSICNNFMVFKHSPTYSSDQYKWRCQRDKHTKDTSHSKRIMVWRFQLNIRRNCRAYVLVKHMLISIFIVFFTYFLFLFNVFN